MRLRLGQLVELWGAPMHVHASDLDLDQAVGPICTDSRQLSEGSFFVPLVGEHFNGHAFLAQALKLEAQAAVVARKDHHPVPEGLPHWIVEDTLEAYQQLGLLHRRQLNVPVVAVTGSAGKTTTRELIRSALTPLGEVLASAGNNNNDVGVPLTLLQAHSDHGAVVVEMGMRGIGEIERLSCCTQPDVAVITNIGNAHVGRLGSRAAIASAKCEITTCLKPRGVIVIPAGDSLLEDALERIWRGRVIRVAVQDNQQLEPPEIADLHRRPLPKADLVGCVDLAKGELLLEGKAYTLPLEGMHNACNLMLALAVARELDVCKESLSNLKVDVPGGRSRRLKVGNFTVLDETYNASPEAVQAALELLAIQPGRHFAVLGTMLELGEQSVALHRQVAERAVQVGLDGLVVVAAGAEAEAMATAAGSLPHLAVVANPEQAAQPLQAWLEAGDVVLLKASRGVALEKLIPLL